MTIDILVADYSNPQHAKDVGFLLNEYAKDPMGAGKPLDTGIQEKVASELAKQAGAFSVLAYVDGKPAALTNCLQSFSTFKCKPLINIHDLAVVKEFRGMGLSTRMLEKVEEVARERDCCKLTLEVLGKNIPAKKSYQKFGFKAYELDPIAGVAEFLEKEL
ncbi:MAG: GNAT family N-acetyltransferase [Gammaproteobacteria bacterium]|nr:GNAT family N-acetyltransferase [Gammaproteobacteria bacterium]NNC97091.1 GNAT family N-acetyltransferase [Gammaproteobacteria bacterium]NNM14078.1 GNAT family N-acetyltransferase [Gammaproteobacteria bacterium]